ncbi:MAG: hypothetical protein IH830_12620 [Planctomycetes bacterium]|nr:hypothetical protein [Planctomycetota bacterium]
MSIKMKDVRAHLELDEPDYDAAAEMGPDALPYLDNLVDGEDTMLASKATYLASLITHPDAVDVLRHAAAHADPVVRVAAAAAAKNVAVADANAVLEPLVGDGDAGVRKVAIKSVPDTPSPSLKHKVESAAADEADPDLRALCRDTLERIGSTTSSLGMDTPSEETMASESGLMSDEGDDMADDGGAGMGGGEFDDRDTEFSDQAEDPDEFGIGGGDFDDRGTELSDQAEDPDEFGGGDGSIDITRGVGGRGTDPADVESSDGFGGGEY